MEAPGKGYMLAFCTTGIHALGAVMDSEADEAGGQTTIAVAFGKRSAAMFAFVSYLLASLTVDMQSFLGIYITVGAVMMAAPCINVAWAHRAFQSIVYFSMVSVVVWFGLKLKDKASGVKLN